MNTQSQLAIIIPFYKKVFFEDLLSALVSQTCQDFNVYVGNDCSPDNPEPILEKYSERLNIKYHRFDERMGNTALSRQWDRCFTLIGEESWVWFLPDDDAPAPNCVEELYNALLDDSIQDVKIFRLPLSFIDGNGNVIHTPARNPDRENNYEFYSRVVRGEATATLGDNIFRRQSFADAGGFVCFPKAWGSDHATLLKVTSGGVMKSLASAMLGFRISGHNISSDMTDGYEKMQARHLFATWLKAHEHIFPCKPDFEFYQYFYWKGEYFALHEWRFSFKMWLELYSLRVKCLGSINPLPVMKLLLFYSWNVVLKDKRKWMRR